MVSLALLARVLGLRQCQPEPDAIDTSDLAGDVNSNAESIRLLVQDSKEAWTWVNLGGPPCRRPNFNINDFSDFPALELDYRHRNQPLVRKWTWNSDKTESHAYFEVAPEPP